MELELSGRVVLIVGGSSGIGAAAARVLGREGAKLALVARRQRELEEIQTELTANGVEVLCMAGDAGSAGFIDEAVQQTVSHFGGLHRLAVVAGPVGARAAARTRRPRLGVVFPAEPDAGSSQLPRSASCTARNTR